MLDRKSSGLMIVALGLVLGLGGAARAEDGGSSAEKPIKAETPKLLMTKFATALDKADRKQFVACFDTTDERHGKIAGAMFDLFHGMNTLKKEVIKAHGKEGWEKFQESNQMGGGPDLPTGTEWVDKLEIETDGDKASTALPGGSDNPIQMVKSDGVWRISFDEEMGLPTTDEQMKQFLTMTSAISSAFMEVSKEVGKEGVTLEQIQTMLGQKVMAAMMKAAQEAQQGGAAPAPPAE